MAVIRQHVIKYSTIGPMQLSFVKGFAVYQNTTTSYMSLQITFVQKAWPKLVYSILQGENKKKILKFKCVEEDLSMIRDGSRMVSWSSGATFLPLYLGRDGGGECVFFKKKNQFATSLRIETLCSLLRLFTDSATTPLAAMQGPWEVVLVVDRSALWPKQPTFKTFTLVLILLLNDRAQKYTNRIERRHPGSYNFELLSHYWTM